jgi:hypothetical protein
VPLLNIIAHRILQGRAARGLACAIPSPPIRVAALALVPMALAKPSKRGRR